MYQISEFSKISKTSIQTLRYYDSLNLLRPNTVGKYNNYRYYNNVQLKKLEVIRKLKQMGFNLNEISNILSKYDEKFLIYKKKKIEMEISNGVKNIKDIEEIINRMKKKNQKFEKILISLINKEERRKIGMKEKYEYLKARLSEGYRLYKSNNFDECLILLEDLKKEIFENSTEQDPFWLDSAGDLFAGITFEVFKNNEESEITFLNIFQFRIKGEEHIDNIKEYTEKLLKDSYSYISLSSVSFAPNETRDSIVSVYKQRMKPLAMFDTKN